MRHTVFLIAFSVHIQLGHILMAWLDKAEKMGVKKNEGYAHGRPRFSHFFVETIERKEDETL